MLLSGKLLPRSTSLHESAQPLQLLQLCILWRCHRGPGCWAQWAQATAHAASALSAAAPSLKGMLCACCGCGRFKLS